MYVTEGDVRGMSIKVRLFDTLSRTKVVLGSKVVRAYFCGPTVYDVPHLGHARAYVVFDVLIRLLRKLGYRVKYVRNVTDVDDKIIRRAHEEGVSPFEIAERYYYEFYDAMKMLKVLPPSVEPRASAHIPEIIEFVRRLVEKGYAYETPDGVYFRVKRFAEYGKLSKRNPEDMLAGARVEPSPYKEDPLDFALWKKAKPGEPSWPSPWGLGRPGWHIECSAMALKHLGETIEIHGGGEDLIFPHHENEIAQSEALTGKPFAKIWFHVGLLTIGREKMAKSLGNIVSVKEALRRYDAETIRYFLLSVHYRRQLAFDWKKMEDAERKLDNLYRALFLAEYLAKGGGGGISKSVKEFMNHAKNAFLSAMADNLDTVNAMKNLHSIAQYILQNHELLTKDELLCLARLMRDLGEILGILEQSMEERVAEKKARGKDLGLLLPPGYVPSETRLVEGLIRLVIEVRDVLRRMKMYDLADSIRARLRELGIVLEDTKSGTKFSIIKA